MEHDACGVGLIASTNGKKSRKIVEYGIEALKAIWHRGAVDADGKSDWEFSEQPIMVFASNIRLSNRFALVSEFWLPPEIEDFSVIPFMSSLRFIGRDFSVDFGGFFEIGSVGESVPLPLLNLTYHFD